jgi:hypothetical protein
MALFVAARIARTSIHERAGHLDRPLVGDLYNDDELPYRAGFRLTLMEVASRFDAGMEELSRMAIVVAVARIDELLGEFINCLGRLAMTCRSGTVDTGVSAKLDHLRRHSGLDVAADTLALYGMLVEVRHAVTHYELGRGIRRRLVDSMFLTTQRQSRAHTCTPGFCTPGASVHLAARASASRAAMSSRSTESISKVISSCESTSVAATSVTSWRLAVTV